MLYRKHLHRWAGAALLLAVTLSACGPAGTPTAEPTATRPLRPTFTPTVIPTDTPTPTETPIPTDTPTPLPSDTPTPEIPVAVVIGEEQSNLRAGPGANYDTVAQVQRDAELEILAKNAAGDWFQVCCVDGQEGWIVARLVEVRGDANLVQIAANIPAPPTNTPVPTRPAAPRPQPTAPPAPTNTPVPTFPFVQIAGQAPRASTNPWITFYGLLFTANQLDAVGDHKLIVEGPGGRFEGLCSPDVLFGGGPDEQSKFIYSCKVEVPGGAAGVYRVYPVDLSGKQAGDAYDLTAQGDLREFFPRWKQR